MAQPEFDAAWQMLRQLESQPPFKTLVHSRLNRIIGSTSTQLVRQTERSDGTGWKDAKPVPRIAFENLWNRLRKDKIVQLSDLKGYKYVVAACLVSVPKLGVEKVKDRPLAIKLGPASEAGFPIDFDNEDSEEFGDFERIVVGPDICSGKPTIRGTRIMVGNIMELGFEGRTDRDVFNWAQANGCIIITFYNDFADRRSFAAVENCGIIRPRVRPTTSEETQRALERLLNQAGEQELPGALVIEGRSRVRIRPGSPPELSN